MTSTRRTVTIAADAPASLLPAPSPIPSGGASHFSASSQASSSRPALAAEAVHSNGGFVSSALISRSGVRPLVPTRTRTPSGKPLDQVAIPYLAATDTPSTSITHLSPPKASHRGASRGGGGAASSIAEFSDASGTHALTPTPGRGIRAGRRAPAHLPSQSRYFINCRTEPVARVELLPPLLTSPGDGDPALDHDDLSALLPAPPAPDAAPQPRPVNRDLCRAVIIAGDVATLEARHVFDIPSALTPVFSSEQVDALFQSRCADARTLPSQDRRRRFFEFAAHRCTAGVVDLQQSGVGVAMLSAITKMAQDERARLRVYWAWRTSLAQVLEAIRCNRAKAVARAETLARGATDADAAAAEAAVALARHQKRRDPFPRVTPLAGAVAPTQRRLLQESLSGALRAAVVEAPAPAAPIHALDSDHRRSGAVGPATQTEPPPARTAAVTPLVTREHALLFLRGAREAVENGKRINDSESQRFHAYYEACARADAAAGSGGSAGDTTQTPAHGTSAAAATAAARARAAAAATSAAVGSGAGGQSLLEEIEEHENLYLEAQLPAPPCWSITHLNLSGNNLGEAGAQALAQLVPHLEDLCVLRLASTNLGDVGAAMLAMAVRRNRTITHLDIGGTVTGAARTSLYGPSIDSLASMLRHNPVLAELNLSHTGLRGDGAVPGVGSGGSGGGAGSLASASIIFRAAATSVSLRKLVLKGNLISQAGLQSRAALVDAPVSSLAKTQKPDVGGSCRETLERLVATAPSLEFLDLSDNGLDNRFITSIAKGLMARHANHMTFAAAQRAAAAAAAAYHNRKGLAAPQGGSGASGASAGAKNPGSKSGDDSNALTGPRAPFLVHLDLSGNNFDATLTAQQRHDINSAAVEDDEEYAVLYKEHQRIVATGPAVAGQALPAVPPRVVTRQREAFRMAWMAHPFTLLAGAISRGTLKELILSRNKLCHAGTDVDGFDLARATLALDCLFQAVTQPESVLGRLDLDECGIRDLPKISFLCAVGCAAALRDQDGGNMAGGAGALDFFDDAKKRTGQKTTGGADQDSNPLGWDEDLSQLLGNSAFGGAAAEARNLAVEFRDVQSSLTSLSLANNKLGLAGIAHAQASSGGGNGRAKPTVADTAGLAAIDDDGAARLADRGHHRGIGAAALIARALCGNVDMRFMRENIEDDDVDNIEDRRDRRFGSPLRKVLDGTSAPHLVHVDVSRNGFNARGLTLIARSVRFNRTLARLEMAQHGGGVDAQVVRTQGLAMTNNECLLHLDHAKGTLDSPLVAQRLQRNRELKLQRLQPEFEATFAEARRQQSAMEQTADAVREEQRRLERMSEVMRNMRERGKTLAAERADEIATLQVAMGEAYRAQEAVERELEEVRERNIEDQRRRENQVERLKSQIEKEMKRRAEVVAQAWDAYEEYVELCHTVQPATPPTVGTAASATIHSGPRHLSRSNGLNTSTASPARRRTSVAGGATPRPDLNTSSAGALADSTSISSARLIQDEEVQLQRELAALLEETATLRGACAVSRKRLESAGVDVSHLAPVDEPATGTPTGQTPMPGQTPAVTGRRRAGSRASDGSRVTVPGPSKPPRTGASTPLPRPVKPVTAKK